MKTKQQQYNIFRTIFKDNPSVYTSTYERNCIYVNKIEDSNILSRLIQRNEKQFYLLPFCFVSIREPEYNTPQKPHINHPHYVENTIVKRMNNFISSYCLMYSITTTDLLKRTLSYKEKMILFLFLKSNSEHIYNELEQVLNITEDIKEIVNKTQDFYNSLSQSDIDKIKNKTKLMHKLWLAD